jgi:hypothetical protein
VYTIFALYSPSYTLSPPHSLSPLPLVPSISGRTYSTLQFSDFVKEKIGIFVCLRQLYRWFPWDISMYIYVL